MGTVKLVGSKTLPTNECGEAVNLAHIREGVGLGGFPPRINLLLISFLP